MATAAWWEGGRGESTILRRRKRIEYNFEEKKVETVQFWEEGRGVSTITIWKLQHSGRIYWWYRGRQRRGESSSQFTINPVPPINGSDMMTLWQPHEEKKELHGSVKWITFQLMCITHILTVSSIPTALISSPENRHWRMICCTGLARLFNTNPGISNLSNPHQTPPRLHNLSGKPGFYHFHSRACLALFWPGLDYPFLPFSNPGLVGCMSKI